MSTTNTMEVDLSTKDALRALDEINRTKTIALMTRIGSEPMHDGHAYEICADGMPIGMFFNVYVDGTWTATAEIALEAS